MKLSPLDIEHKEFGTGLNGYNKRQVDEFLALLAEQTEELLRENQTLRDEIARKDKAIEELQSAELELKRAVIAAERIGNEMKHNAKREADLIIKEAEYRKDLMLRDSHQRLREIQGELSRLEHERDLFREQFRGMLKAFERGLDKLEESQKRVPIQRPATVKNKVEASGG
jgi:cell division initiation protein